jgi:hypothetical protein
MKTNIALITVIVLLLAALYYLFSQNKELKQDVTRWQDNYASVSDSLAKTQQQVQDVTTQAITERELARTSNDQLSARIKTLQRENSRLERLISANIEIKDTVLLKVEVPCTDSFTLNFTDRWLAAKVRVKEKEVELTYKVSAPIDLAVYQKQVPENPTNWTEWAIRHKLTKWLVKKRYQDRAELTSENPNLTSTLQSFKVIRD